MVRLHNITTCLYVHPYHVITEDDPFLERLPGSFEEVAMSVQENHRFSLIDDLAWAKTMPGHRGFVRLGPEGRSFGVAAYHQLHCINALRFSYTVARDGLVTDPAELSAKLGHDNHCFQFVRQAILCKADDALVPIDGSNQTFASAGFGVTHRCRNWAQVRDFVLQNDAKWAGIPYMGTEGL